MHVHQFISWIGAAAGNKPLEIEFELVETPPQGASVAVRCVPTGDGRLIGGPDAPADRFVIQITPKP